MKDNCKWKNLTSEALEHVAKIRRIVITLEDITAQEIDTYIANELNRQIEKIDSKSDAEFIIDITSSLMKEKKAGNEA